MLKTIYAAFDRNRRPLRDRHCVLLAERDIAFIRIPHAASMLARHPLDHLISGSDGRSAPDPTTSRLGWIEGTRLVSPRELLLRPDPAFTFAIIRHPGHRLAACYRKQIEERDAVSDAWMLRGFRSGMGFQEFVQRACSIGDTRADNHTRSQTALLSHKGNMLAARLLRAERLAADWEALRAELFGARLADIGPCPDIDEATTLEDASQYDALPRLEKRRIRSRYAADFQSFYEDGELGENRPGNLAPAYSGVQ